MSSERKWPTSLRDSEQVFGTVIKTPLIQRKAPYEERRIKILYSYPQGSNSLS